MVFAGSVNNDFEHLEKLTHARQTGWDPRAERADVGGLLAVDGRGVTRRHK